MMPDHLASLRVLTIEQVCILTTFTRQHLARLERAGRFPKRRRMGENRVVFLEHEYIAWFMARPIATPEPDPDDPEDN